MMFDASFETLMESLLISDLLGNKTLSDFIDFKTVKSINKLHAPITRALYYNYDFGDDWHVKITRHKDIDEYLKMNLTDEKSIIKSLNKVEEKHQPVCIYQSGDYVMDDVGGLHGYVNFVQTINGSNFEEKESMLEWAKIFDWKKGKMKPSQML